MSVIKSGSSGNVAEVNDDKQILTKSVVETELEFVSEESGGAYSWSSSFATGGADVEVLAITNTSSTKNLYIDYFMSTATANTVYTAFTTTDTPGGTAITGKNLNAFSGSIASAASYGNAAVTGVTAAGATDVVFYGGQAANASFGVNLRGAIILGQNNTLVITCSASATVYSTLIGHYKDKQ